MYIVIVTIIKLTALDEFVHGTWVVQFSPCMFEHACNTLTGVAILQCVSPPFDICIVTIREHWSECNCSYQVSQSHIAVS